MKNKIIILLVLLVISSKTFAQTYISRTAYSVNDILQSSILNNVNRIDYTQAFNIRSNIDAKHLNKNNFSGEFFHKNNILINVVVITQKDALYMKPLKEIQDWTRMMASGGESRPIEEYFIDKFITLNNFKSYVSYFKNGGNSASIIIQDNQGKYSLNCTIYYQSNIRNNIGNEITTILNSINFK